MLKTYKISISGQVQGVGFRPYVYNLVTKYSLKGTVSNDENGVAVFVTGLLNSISEFYSELINNPPPLAKVFESCLEEITITNFKDFKIIPSEVNGGLNLPLTPDFAICENCKEEIKNTSNQRFNYPFTTCVNCGPRWSVTKTFPFERNHTSINGFEMCESCLAEYGNPTDRRFHSQTNTCSTCGIDLKLTNSKGEIIDSAKESVFIKVAQLIAENKIVAIKNTSGYLLCCNAENKEVIEKLRFKKNRPNKPFAILYPSIDLLKKEVEISNEQEQLLNSPVSPIVITSLNNFRGNIALENVAPGLSQLGIMLPNSGILQLLANQLNFPIIATSGNMHGSPIISDNSEAIEKLKNVADYFLQHNLEIVHPQDDSVTKFSYRFKKKVLFRRSRGLAPNFLNVDISSNEKIMAMGAHLKSTIAYCPNEYLYISQYLGNLDNFDVYNRFEKTSKSFLDIFQQTPKVILVDKHPSYQSTHYGKELSANLNSKLVEIQHHKAHFAAVLGEHNLFDEKVLGVVFDGTGLGDDSQIWGGEFFNYEANRIERINHLEYFDWLLGDKMSKEPRISLFSLASEEMQEKLRDKFTSVEIKTYQSLKKTNKLKTSSIGRLFDAVASLLNITDYNSYEGAAAILLENQVQGYNIEKCRSYLNNAKFSAKNIIRNIYKDIGKGISNEEIIINFLFTLASFIIEKAKNNDYKNVALSGGVFQNTTLVDVLIELAPEEIKLYFHKDLSPNDENISFGQMMYYFHIKN